MAPHVDRARVCVVCVCVSRGGRFGGGSSVEGGLCASVERSQEVEEVREVEKRERRPNMPKPSKIAYGLIGPGRRALLCSRGTVLLYYCIGRDLRSNRSRGSDGGKKVNGGGGEQWDDRECTRKILLVDAARELVAKAKSRMDSDEMR